MTVPAQKSPALVWVAILAALTFELQGLVRRDPVLSRDDEALIRPLQRAHGLADYVAGVRGGQVLDLQPVRDASLWGDLALHRLTGVSTFHLTNLALLLVLLVLLQRLLAARWGPTWAVAAVVALYAFHPVVANTVSWIAARKHLLSAVFILAATVVATRKDKPLGPGRQLAAVALYTLSVLSQPITLLWPAWLALELWLQTRNLKSLAPLLVPLAGVALVVGGVNVWYYRTIFVSLAHGSKFVEAPEGTIAVSLLAIGRYLFNCILPVAVATTYDPGRWFNLVGLCLLPLLAFVSLKLGRTADVVSGWGMFLFPLIPVTARMTNIFVSDTYLLVPLAGLGMVGLAVWDAVGNSRGRAAVAGVAAALAAVAFIMQSHVVAASWSSEAALWDHAYHTEPTPNALAKQSFYLLGAGRLDESLQVAEQLLEWEPHHPEAAYVFAHAVAESRSLTPREKLARLDASPAHDAWTDYFGAVVAAKAGDYGAALARVAQAADGASRFGGQAAVVAAEAEFFCRKAGRSDCEALVAKYEQSAGAAWEPMKYAGRRRSLGLAETQNPIGSP
ncbi:MAG: hypothetical protein JST54_15850 [Deltaproteobacteria bacterium]|nr:hypothetical protein [Deltaproteobacteria bacterium]